MVCAYIGLSVVPGMDYMGISSSESLRDSLWLTITYHVARLGSLSSAVQTVHEFKTALLNPYKKVGVPCLNHVVCLGRFYMLSCYACFN